MQEEYFRSGVEPEDIPALFPLLRAKESLAAFTAVFRGSDGDVLVRLPDEILDTITSADFAAIIAYFIGNQNTPDKRASPRH